MKMFGINEPLEVPEDVAVIGSSPRLNGKGLGSEIDSTDCVVRFNGAMIEGFEEDVGSRTDFVCVGLDLAYFFNYPFVPPKGDVVKEESPNRWQNALILSGLFSNARFITWAYEEERVKKNMQHSNGLFLRKAAGDERVFTWAHENAPNEVKGNFQGNRILMDFGIEPTLAEGRGMRTGFRVILMLVKSGVVPKIYGFDVDPSLTHAKHYYDNFISDHFDENKAHDFRGEIMSLISLHEKGLVDIRG